MRSSARPWPVLAYSGGIVGKFDTTVTSSLPATPPAVPGGVFFCTRTRPSAQAETRVRRREGSQDEREWMRLKAGMSTPQSRSGPLQKPQITRDLEAALAGHKAGQRDRAERLCRKVLRRESQQPDALRLLGVIASEKGRHEYAVQLLSRALAGPTGSAEAHYSLGNALRALGRIDKAASTTAPPLR